MAPTFPLLARLWRDILHPLRARIALAAFFTLGLAAITALYPIVIQQAFDRFNRGDPSVVWFLPPIIIAVTALRGGFLYAQQHSLQGTVLRALETLQNRLFEALTRADLATVTAFAPARQAARFTTDATQIRDALARALGGLGDLFTIVGLVASMLWLDWQLALGAALLYPLAAVPIIRIGKRIRRASAGMQDRVGETAALVTESLSAARVVRAYRLEAAEEARAAAAFRGLRQSLFAIASTRARVDPVLEVLGGLTVALVLGFVGWRVSNGQGTIGEFTGFVAALLIASRPIRALGSLNAAFQEGLAGLARVFAVLDEPRRIADAAGAVPLPAGGAFSLNFPKVSLQGSSQGSPQASPQASPPTSPQVSPHASPQAFPQDSPQDSPLGLVEFRDVHFTYGAGEAAALSGLSFTALPGQTVALVGPSGAGKSTAIMLLPRLHDVTAGAVLLDGADVRATRLDSLRDAIAYVGQESLLFDDTALANIACGRPGATRAAVEDAARAAAAHAFIEALPQGYDTPLGPGGGRLSGGQRQRISLARALLRNPRVLLLDEATSALDAENEQAVQQAIAVLRQGRTSLVIAHRLATVRDADLIVVMEAGRAVEQGSHAALVARDGLYARLVRAQTFAA